MMLSKNGVGLVVFALSLIGVNVADADLMVAISVLGQVFSGVLMFINQVKRSDSKWFIFKQ